jgi:hypothetical protein
MKAGHPMPATKAWLWPAAGGAGCGLVLLVAVWLVLDRELGLAFVRGMAGTLTTPFILEGTLVVCGFAIVGWLNHRRRRREGDGWVFLAEDEPAARDGQPPGRHDAVFAAAPETPPEGLDLDVIEGLLELGSWDEAGRALLELAPAEAGSPRGLDARLRLAEALGRDADAAALRRARAAHPPAES